VSVYVPEHFVDRPKVLQALQAWSGLVGARLVDPENLAGVAEIAARFGVSRRAVGYWVASTGFPAPVATLAAGPVYDLTEVEGWRETRA